MWLLDRSGLRRLILIQVPPNLQFEIDDVEDEWRYSRPFDYIHIRAMGGSIRDWPKLMQQAYQNLRPNGWIEVTDFEAWVCSNVSQSCDNIGR